MVKWYRVLEPSRQFHPYETEDYYYFLWVFVFTDERMVLLEAWTKKTQNVHDTCRYVIRGEQK